MRATAALIAVLALAACRGAPPSILNEAELATEQQDLNALLAGLPEAPASQQQLSPAEIQSRVAQVMAGRQVTELRPGRARAICGRVQVPGGTRPFVLRADDRLFISAQAEIGYGDPADPFPDVYLEFCASAEELQQVRSAPLPPPPPDLIAPPAETVPEGEAEAQTPPPAEPSRPPARTFRPPATPPGREGEGDTVPGEDTDFFNAVRRPDGAA